MTVGEFKRELEKYDDSLNIGGIGHFGEILDIHSVDIKDDLKPFIGISMEYPGPDPD